jgi:hypothetical protein
MKQITITGPFNQVIDAARQQYAEQVAAGLHTILDAPGDLRTSMQGRRMSDADIIITARPDHGPLTTTTD